MSMSMTIAGRTTTASITKPAECKRCETINWEHRLSCRRCGSYELVPVRPGKKRSERSLAPIIVLGLMVGLGGWFHFCHQSQDSGTTLTASKSIKSTH